MIVACVAILAAFLLQCAIYRGVALDDPFITFRYAWNLAHGNGLVWNAGEAPVEGYTELPWVLLSALAIRLGLHPLAAMQAAGVLSGAVLLALMLTRANLLAARPLGRVVSAALLAISPVYAFYAVSGMAHVFFALVVAGGALLFCRALKGGGDAWWGAAGAAFGLAAFTRPEGLGLFLVALGFAAAAVAATRPAATWRSLAWLAGPFLCIWGPFMAWRLMRYGYLLPNTYYAKYGNSGFRDVPLGVLYLSRALEIYAGMPFAAALVFYLAQLGKPPEFLAFFRRFRVEAFCALLVMAVVGYTGVIGGDDIAAFPSVRLILPALPILFMLVGAALESLGSRLAPWQSASVAGAFFAVCGLQMAGDGFVLSKIAAPDLNFASSALDLVKRAFAPTGRNYLESPVGTWINATLHRPCTIAVPQVGRLGYETMKCTVIDPDGLNDVHIAHLAKRQRGLDVKGDPPYVISRRPDLIVVNVDKDYWLGTKTFAQAGGWKLVDRDMLDLLRHSPDYRFVNVPITEETVFERVGQ